MTRLYLLLTVLLLLPGCFLERQTVNSPLERSAVETLVPGQSTAADVAALLGAPSEVIQLGKRSAWRYDYGQSKRTGFLLLLVVFTNNDARSDRVWVFFDEEDLLVNIGSTFESDGAQYLMPWQDIDYE